LFCVIESSQKYNKESKYTIAPDKRHPHHGYPPIAKYERSFASEKMAEHQNGWPIL